MQRRAHDLSEKEMELVKLLMADYQNISNIQNMSN